jgi:hypothetical protein
MLALAFCFAPVSLAHPTGTQLRVSNNHHRQQWTRADTDGRCFPGQAGRSAGSPHRALASGRRGRFHCRIWPYLSRYLLMAANMGPVVCRARRLRPGFTDLRVVPGYGSS